MKIGIDARVLYMPVLKGIGVYLRNLLINLSRIDQKNQYILYYDTRQNLFSHCPKARNFTSKGISIRKGDRFHFWEQIRLPFEISKDKIDVFHSPANTTMFSSGCPKLVTVHDTILQETLNGKAWERFYFGKLQPSILRKAANIITVSKYSKNKIMEIMNVPESRINIVYNGISSSFGVTSSREMIEETKNKYRITSPYIFSAGGESPWKNISCLIKAYSILVDKYKIKEQLVITGIRTKEILESHLKEISGLGLSGRVLILGYVSEDELINLYNGAKLFVYPSLKEGFGFPPLEAMACGVPVVASNEASIPEVVGDAAILVDAKDAENLSKAIIDLLQNEELLSQLIEKGFKRSKEFSWERAAQDTLRLYEKVLRKQKN